MQERGCGIPVQERDRTPDRGDSLAKAEGSPRTFPHAACQDGGSSDRSGATCRNVCLKCPTGRMREPGGDYAEMAAKLAALEERMKTMQAEYKSDIAQLAKQIAEHDRERDYRVLIWMAVLAGIIIAAVRP